MAKPKWTPGPWKAVNRAGSMQVDSRNGTVCERMGWLPDASLIAAAPDLHAALTALLDNSGYTQMSDDDLRHEAELGNGLAPILLGARAALSKAEGHT